MATLTVKDALGANQTVGKYIPGRTAAAESAPVVLSTEDQAVLSALLAKLPELGQRAAAASMSVALATDHAGVATYVAGGAPVNRSGTITAGGTAQALMAANASRRGFWVRNLSTADLWVNELGAAAIAGQPSHKLAPGEFWETAAGACGTAAVSIFGATTGQAFTAREY